MNKQKKNIIRLGDAASFVNGFAFKPEQWGAVGRPIIRIQNLNNQDAEFNYYDGPIPEKYIVNDGDILISWSASLGAYEWNRGEALLNQHIFKVVFDKADINKHFLRYAVLSKLTEMEKDAHGATMRHIVKKDFDNTIVPFPSREEQERIVRELDLLTNIIDKKNQQLRDLDALAQSIFYEMFGDPIANEKGWPICHFGELCNSELGKMLDSKRASGTRKPYLCTINVLWDKIDLSTQKEMLIEDDELKRYSVRKGDLLICEGGDIGRSAIWDREDEMYYQNSIHRVRFDETKMLPEVMLYIFKILKDRGELDQYGKGQTIKHLVKKSLLSIPVPVPDVQVQRAFAKKLSSIKNNKALVQQSLVSTQLLFESQMNQYFND